MDHGVPSTPAFTSPRMPLIPKGACYLRSGEVRMSRRPGRGLLPPIALRLRRSPRLAQQTGAIIGKVTASDGAVLPGVTIEARSDVLPGPRVTTTAGNGEYRLPALPPGSYALTFTFP